MGFLFGGRYRTRFNQGVAGYIYSENLLCSAIPHPASDSPPDCRIEIGSSPISNTIPKRKTHPFGWVFFLVDDIGLEPMTFRTSSGCSSQLS